MADIEIGRPDLYQAFLKLGIELVKPGGFVLFVLPHPFLVAEQAQKLRAFVRESGWIHFLGVERLVANAPGDPGNPMGAA